MSKEITAIEQAVISNDLSKLTIEERSQFYKAKCDSLGLNPLGNPFQYIVLNGKLTLYATKDCTAQLSKNHRLSISITSREKIDDLYIVSAKATSAEGRTDESIGAVNIAGLKGDALANAFMKAETKAKRRVILSLAGLGILDESETETISGAQKVEVTYQVGKKKLEDKKTKSKIEFHPNEVSTHPLYWKIKSTLIPSSGKQLLEIKRELLEKGLNNTKQKSLLTPADITHIEAALKLPLPGETDPLYNSEFWSYLKQQQNSSPSFIDSFYTDEEDLIESNGEENDIHY